jgi:hypothetical protein
VSQSPSFREAHDADQRRRHLTETGRRVTATIVAAHPTGQLVGITPMLEIVLEVELDVETVETVETGTERRRTVTIVEPVPWALASRLVPGSTVIVLMATDSATGADGVMLDWSR